MTKLLRASCAFALSSILLAILAFGNGLDAQGVSVEHVVAEAWQLPIVPKDATHVRCVGLSQRQLTPFLREHTHLESVVLESVEFYDLGGWLMELKKAHPAIRELHLGRQSPERTINGDQMFSRCTGSLSEDAYGALEGLGGLRSLTLALDGQVFDDVVATRLGKLLELRSLHLPVRVATTKDGATAFSRLKHLEDLVLAGQDNAAVQILSHLPLRRLCLLDCDVSLAGFSAIGAVERLEELEVSGTDNYEARLGGGALSSLVNLNVLRRLVLVRCDGVAADDLSEFLSRSKLAELGLIYCLGREPFATAVRASKSLATLVVWSRDTTDEDVKHIASLSTLKKLDLRHSAGVSVGGMAPLAACTALEDVRFPEGWRISNDDDFSRLTSLVSLSVLAVPPSSPSPLAFSRLFQLRKLRVLDISACSGLNDEHFKGIGGLEQLEVLALPEANACGDKALRELAKLNKISSLRFVGWASITDEGLNGIVAMTKLQSLAVWNAPLVTGAFLKNESGESELKEIDIRYCDKVTDEALTRIGELHLEKVTLRGLAQLTGVIISKLANTKELIGLSLRDNPVLRHEHLTHLTQSSALTYVDIRGCKTIAPTHVAELQNKIKRTLIVSSTD